MRLYSCCRISVQFWTAFSFVVSILARKSGPVGSGVLLCYFFLPHELPRICGFVFYKDARIVNIFKIKYFIVCSAHDFSIHHFRKRNIWICRSRSDPINYCYFFCVRWVPIYHSDSIFF